MLLSRDRDGRNRAADGGIDTGQRVLQGCQPPVRMLLGNAAVVPPYFEWSAAACSNGGRAGIVGDGLDALGAEINAKYGGDDVSS